MCEVKRKIFAIDDDLYQLEIIKELVDKESDLEAQLFSTIEGVVDEAISQQPDLIITDLYLPDYNGMMGKTGFLLAKELKDNPATKDIPIVMLSSERNISDHMTARLWRGCSDFLVKPVTPQRLLESLHIYSLLGHLNKSKKDHTLVNLDFRKLYAETKHKQA